MFFGGFSGLPVFSDDARFFDELDTELRQHFVFREVAERGHVTPVGRGGSEEEIAVEGRYLGSADFRTLESRLVYERSGGMAFGIFEERSARASGRLFGFAEFSEGGDVHRLVRVPFFTEREVERGGDDESVGGVFQSARTVGEPHFAVGKRFHLGFRDVPYVGRNEHVGGFETETSGVSNHGTSETARESDPRDEPDVSFGSEKEGHRVDFFGGRDFEASGRDSRRVQRGRFVEHVSEARERVLYHEPREAVEGEETVGSVAQVRHGETGGLRRGHGLGKDRQIGFRSDLEKIRRFRGRFKSRKGAHVPFGHYRGWKFVRHTFSMVSRKGAKSNGVTRRRLSSGTGQVRHPPSGGEIWR